MPNKPSDYSNFIREKTRQVDIDSFKERGVRTVNVINADQINDMITEAVNLSLLKYGTDVGRDKIIQDSIAEFRSLLKKQSEKSNSGHKEMLFDIKKDMSEITRQISNIGSTIAFLSEKFENNQVSTGNKTLENLFSAMQSKLFNELEKSGIIKSVDIEGSAEIADAIIKNVFKEMESGDISSSISTSAKSKISKGERELSSLLKLKQMRKE